MTRIHIPAPGLDPWQAGLADPIKHWKDGKSAKELARSWVSAETTPRGLPPKVAELLDQEPALSGATLLLGIPEHPVELPSSGRPSMNDLFCVLRGPKGLVSLAVEGKSGESFDRPLSEWLAESSQGKRARLEGMCALLGVATEPPPSLRYQLFHRTASPIIEAQRWGISTAVMLVHSFGGAADDEGRRDFDAFCVWLGVSGGPMRSKRLPSGIQLFAGWVADKPV